MHNQKNGLLNWCFCFALLFFSFQVQAQMCLPTWKYRTPVVINNAGNGALTNYQVMVTLNTSTLVSAGKMRADGGDIRFTESNCCTPVCHWVEKGMNTPATTIWIKMPNLPAGGLDTVYLHYGDTTQTTNQNGDCVFEFFDDFSGNSLNPLKWTTRGTPSILTVSNGELAIQGNSNWEYIRSNTTFTSKVKIHDRRKHANMTGSAGFVMGYTGTDNRFTFRYNSSNSGMAITLDTDIFGGNAWFNQTYPLVPYNTVYNNFENTAAIVASNIQITNYCNSTTANCNAATTNLSGASGAAFYVGYSSYSDLTIMNSDYVFVRKFTATADPTTSIGSEFQMPARPMATMADTAICSGSSISFNGGAGHFAYNWFNGGSTQSYTANFPPDDTIWCNVTDGMGCNFTDTVLVTTLALPSDFITPVTAGVCPGDSFEFDAGIFANYLWSTLDTTPTIWASNAGTYYAAVTDSNGCIGSDTVTLTAFIPVVPSISPASWSLCPGDSVLLDAGPDYDSYLWINNDTNQTLLVDSGGSYSIVVIDSNGCTSSDTAIVTAVPNPVVNITPDSITACSGTTVCLDAGPGFFCYTWNNGVSAQINCNTTTPMIYSVTVCDANNCIGSDSATVNYYPVFTATITQNGDTLLSSPAVTYQWLLNNSPIAGATNQTHVGTSSGNYAVIATDANGCIDTSNVISFTVSMEQASLSTFSIYPNPASHQITVHSGIVPAGICRWEIISVTGQKITTGNLSLESSDTEITVSGLSPGIYILRLHKGDEIFSIKFMKE